MAPVWRRLAYPVSGSVSVFGGRFAVGVGDLRERVRPAVPLHRVYPARAHALRIPRTPHELAHALAHAARTRLTRAAYHLDFPPLSNRSVL